MKTMYINQRTNIVVDTEQNSVGCVNRSRVAIEDIYLVKENMHVVYQQGTYKREFDVEPGDIIVTFYADEFDNKIIVVKSSDWKENIINYEAKEEERKLKWAAENTAEACIPNSPGEKCGC